MTRHGPFARLRNFAQWRLREAATWPARMAEHLFATPWHDLVASRRTRHSPGAQPETARVAIFVIYPAQGLWPSHLDTLRALVDAGVSPLVVSNLPLSDAQRDLLHPLSWQIIERENFGYDFGAYRAGLLSLQSRAEALEAVLLVNDSVWLPVGAASWIGAALDAPEDLYAAVSNYGVQGDGGWRVQNDHPLFHYCSFALRFGPALLKAPGFWRYWRRFRLSNDKLRTIQRGEVGLSRWALAEGYSHGAQFPLSALPAHLAAKGLGDLRRIAADLVIPEDAALRAAREAALAAAMQDDQPEPARAEALRGVILRIIAETGPAYALPRLAIEELGVSFVKKSPLWLDAAAADVTLALLSDHCPPGYLDEARALAAGRRPSPPTQEGTA